jgi:hypothetical protein
VFSLAAAFTHLRHEVKTAKSTAKFDRENNAKQRMVVRAKVRKLAVRRCRKFFPFLHLLVLIGRSAPSSVCSLSPDFPARDDAFFEHFQDALPGASKWRDQIHHHTESLFHWGIRGLAQKTRDSFFSTLGFPAVGCHSTHRRNAELPLQPNAG